MTPHILKVPYDSGHRCERMARGPGYLISNHVLDGATVEAIETTLPFTPEIQTAFDLARQIAVRVRAMRETGEFPVILSGNCNSGVGTIAGLGPRETGVLWFDGHGEFHTPETTHSGFLDGMPLAIATGRCWRRLAESLPGFCPLPDANVILAGARDTDPEEQTALDASGIRQVRHSTDIGEALEAVAARTSHWYIHLDLDVLDPSEATANQWTTPGGWVARDIAAAIEHAGQLLPIAAIALASLDPACDPDGRALAIARDLLRVAVTANRPAR